MIELPLQDPEADPSDSPDALTPGTLLDDVFRVDRLICCTGFGIVYLARDLTLDCPVVIKEYLPGAIARRGLGQQVITRATTHAPGFAQGLRAFVQEAQMLARCDHPSLLRVTRLWQANGTAYRVMPFYAGHSLLSWRHSLPAPPDDALLRSFANDLLGALKVVHHAGLVHRRVMPANILVRTEAPPVLMDFDAVRYTLVSDKAQSLMAAIDPGYSADASMAWHPELPQTAASDLHSLAATLHFCISGQPPSLSGGLGTRRDSLREVIARLRVAHPGLSYSSSWVDAIDKALHPDPAQWPQSVAEFRALLEAQPAPAKPAAAQTESEVAPSPEAVAAPAAAAEPSLLSSSAPAASSDKEEPHSEFFPLFGDRLGIDAEHPPRASRSTPPGARNSRPMPIDPPLHRSSPRGGDSTFGEPSTLGEPRRPRVEPARPRNPKLVPWAIAAVVLGMATMAIWKAQDERQQDRLLSEIAKSVPLPELSLPHTTPHTLPSSTGTIVANEEVTTAPSTPASVPPPVVVATGAIKEAAAPAAPESRIAEVSLPSEPTSAGPAAPVQSTERPKPETRPTPEKQRASAAVARSDPRGACGNRTQFSLYRCMQTQCGRAHLAQHPSCKQWRARGETG